MTTADVQRLCTELGLDAVGVTRAEPYDGTERHIRERRGPRLSGPPPSPTPEREASGRPERLRAGARGAAPAALGYGTPAPPPPRPGGRPPRSARRDGYATLREKLDELGRALGAPYR